MKNTFFLLFFVKAHLVTVMHLERPASVTPSTLFSWSLIEPIESLTELGIFQVSQSGHLFRDKYQQFLSDEELSLVLYAKNTNFSRLSATKFSENLNVPVEIIIEANQTHDFLMSPETSCPRIHWLLQRDQVNSSVFIEHWKEISPFLEDFSNVLNEEVDIFALKALGQLVISYNERNLDFPINFPKELQKIAEKFFYRYCDLLLYGSKDQGMLATHSFFSHFFAFFNSEKFLTAEVFFFDKPLFMAVQRMIGLDYHSDKSVTVELHIQDSSRILKFFRENEEIVVKECPEKCELGLFFKLFEKRMFKDNEYHKNLCEVVGDDPITWKDYGPIAFVMVVMFGIFMFTPTLTVWGAKKLSGHLD